MKPVEDIQRNAVDRGVGTYWWVTKDEMGQIVEEPVEDSQRATPSGRGVGAAFVGDGFDRIRRLTADLGRGTKLQQWMAAEVLFSALKELP